MIDDNDVERSIRSTICFFYKNIFIKTRGMIDQKLITFQKSKIPLFTVKKSLFWGKIKSMRLEIHNKFKNILESFKDVLTMKQSESLCAFIRER